MKYSIGWDQSELRFDGPPLRIHFQLLVLIIFRITLIGREMIWERDTGSLVRTVFVISIVWKIGLGMLSAMADVRLGSRGSTDDFFVVSWRFLDSIRIGNVETIARHIVDERGCISNADKGIN